MYSAVARNFRNQSIRTVSSMLLNQSSGMIVRSGVPTKLLPGINYSDLPVSEFPSRKMSNSLNGVRGFSAKSMRSKVEKRMQRESGKTLREIRRAKKLRKKLMTDEERLIYNLRRAKKKVALLLQKLKKYELPELPSPRHDPELLTSEQLQSYRKIGFRNKNYVPVGVRGVFGGVVQNMHLHWKFHETVQVCCDNFPKEKIKEMATMLARLSGGIVVNIHNVKTIIMFRGRNYRQPKNLIPVNTLTKRKALFKARFEQALESQKLNIKKIEQELRRKGVNPDDPVAMASIHRVASTFFNAIDKKEGSPYVFREDRTKEVEPEGSVEQPRDAGDDSDQEELDRFIAEIEDAADKEWAEEEAAEKEELGRIRYWNREDFGGRFRRHEVIGSEDSDDEIRDRTRNLNNSSRKFYRSESEEEEEDDEWGSNDDREVNDGSDGYNSGEAVGKFAASKSERRQHNRSVGANSSNSNRNAIKQGGTKKPSTVLSDLDDITSDSDEAEERQKPMSSHSYRRTDDEKFGQLQRYKGRSNFNRDSSRGTAVSFDDNYTDNELPNETEVAEWRSDATSGDNSAK